MRSLRKGTTMNTITVTEKTTLGELLSILDLAEKSGKTPTPKELFETAGDPIAETNDCTLFSNGFAIYQNITGRTVVWLPYCKSFTYYFNKLRDSEKDTPTETYELPEGFLETQPWVIAVTLIGDHRVEANSMNRTGSRKDTTDYDSADNGDKDGDEERALSDPFRRAFVPEEAKVVRMIYRSFMEGLSCYKIAKMLMEREIPAPAGGEKWHRRTVESILTN